VLRALIAMGKGTGQRLVAAIVLAVGVLFLAQVALASVPAEALSAVSPPTHFGYLSKFGSYGTGAGEFTEAQGVAVSPGSGDVYVTDRETSRVQRFDPDGDFLGEFGEAGSGRLDQPAGIAVDPATGDVYVFDDGNARVVRYDAAGAYLGQFGGPGDGLGQFGSSGSVGDGGLAIDPATQTLYVVDSPNNRVESFTLTGDFLGQFGNAGTGPGALVCPNAIAINPGTAGVYVAEAGCGLSAVLRFTADGSFLGTFADGVAELPSAVAVDPVSGNVYVADFYGERVDILDADGRPLGVFGRSDVDGGALDGPQALAVDPRNQDVYVADVADYVAKFGETTLRATSAGVSCQGVDVAVGREITCVASVTDVDSGSAVTPTGTVEVSSLGAGNIRGVPCSLAGTGASASCAFGFRPTSLGDIQLIAAYSGDDAHTASDNGFFNETFLYAAYRTRTRVGCHPRVVAVSANTTCTARVIAPSGDAPSGTVSFTSDDHATLLGSPCTLTSAGDRMAECQVTYSSTLAGDHAITATYISDPTHLASTRQTTVYVK
jgi:DNA-binding beta-propeller fold protein YncE